MEEEIPDLPRFYAPEILPGIPQLLDEEDARHTRVLRLESDSMVHVCDGRGNLWLARLEPSKKAVQFTAIHAVIQATAPSFATAIAFAPPKNPARTEWFIEKATEMGIGHFYFLNCERSERTHLKLERLSRIAISAMKQSKNLWLPTFHEAKRIDQLDDAFTGKKWIAHCDVQRPRADLSTAVSAAESSIIAIGPEGDFTPKEIDAADHIGFQGLSLGPARLRTETAAMVACAALCVFQSKAH